MDAYGYNALSGFFGSTNMKSQRNAEIMYLEKIYNLQRQQQAIEQKEQEDSQKLIDLSYQTAVELTTGKNTRRKDLLDLQEMSSDLLTPINEKIRKAGGYQKAKRLGIDEDLRNYQYQLLNNDKIYQMKQNQIAIAAIIQADADGKGHLVNERTRNSFNDWRNEVTDKVEWRGSLDGEIDLSFINEYDRETPINTDDYIYNNKHILAADWAYFIAGDDTDKQNEAYNYAINNPGIMNADGWVDRKLGKTKGFDRNIKFGLKDVETTLSQQLMKGQEQIIPDLRAAEIIENGGYAKYVSDNGLLAFYETNFSIDEKSSNIETKNSRVADVAGQLFVNDKEMEFRVIDAALRNDSSPGIPDDYYIDRKGNYVLRMNENMMSTMFDYKGESMAEEGGYLDRTADDMRINGIYLGAKAVYKDLYTGEVKEMLLTKGVKDLDPTDRAKFINEQLKGKAELESVTYKPAYIMQLVEEEFIDDVYYKEINLGNNKVLTNLKDEQADKDLSTAKNERARINAETETRKRKAEVQAQVAGTLDSIYATGDQGVQVLFNAYQAPAAYTFAANKIPSSMNPFVMADIFDMSQRLGKSQGQNAQDFSGNVSNVLNNFSRLADTSPNLYRIYQSGNTKALMDYYKETLSKKEFEEKKSRFRLWAKYFK